MQRSPEIEDVRLPNGVMVRIRAPRPADAPALEQLAAAADAVRVGTVPGPASREGALVAEHAWSREVVGHVAWSRRSGSRATAGAAVGHAFGRTPLVAHLLVRLARLADEALLPALVLSPLDVTEPAARFVIESFEEAVLGDGTFEVRTEDWQEGLARVRRLDRVPEPPEERAADRSRRAAKRATGPDGVVIAGGGVAALECLMALRDLAGSEMRIRLVTPAADFVYRPLAVAEPFSLGRARRYPLAGIAADFGAEVIQDAVAEVQADARRLVTATGATVRYGALVVALGARPAATFPDAITFGQDGAPEALRRLLAALEAGDARHVAFVAPGGVTWTLPLYELALMTAREARQRGVADARLSLVTPEPRPLAVFGPPVSAAIGELLEAEGVEFVGSTYAESCDGGLALEPGGRALAADAVVALPALRGPALAGLPADRHGFIPTDRHGRVDGVDDVFAAGDATAFPVKHGGLAAQQADAVAETLAAAFGARLEPRPFKPVLRGLLYTGGDDRFLRAGIGGGEGDAVAAANALWWPPTKVAGLYLAPYLAERDRSQPVGEPPSGFTEVAVRLNGE